MKRFVILLILLSFNLFANEWQEYWINAIQDCHNKDYEKAEINFNLAIAEIEKNHDESAPHVYVDRGRLFFLQERNLECLLDLDKALSNPQLEGKDLQRARVTRLFTLGRLKMDREALLEMEKLKSVCNFPKTEFTQDKIIIRNIPNCDCYQNLITAFLLNSGMCQKEEDIQILPSGVCIAKRDISACDCNCSAGNILNCKALCDKVTLAGNVWCGKNFKSFSCQVACAQAVDWLKDGCYWCCSSGNFYQKCIKPFEDIVGAMGNVCDPAWD